MGWVPFANLCFLKLYFIHLRVTPLTSLICCWLTLLCRDWIFFKKNKMQNPAKDSNQSIQIPSTHNWFTLWINPSSIIEQLNFLYNSNNASTSFSVTVSLPITQTTIQIYIAHCINLFKTQHTHIHTNIFQDIILRTHCPHFLQIKLKNQCTPNPKLRELAKEEGEARRVLPGSLQCLSQY